MKRNNLTIYYCEFCTAQFATFARFPVDVNPYCTNCGNDEDIVEVPFEESCEVDALTVD